MTHSPGTWRHPSHRLKGYDYSQSGGYFVTICTEHRRCTLGEVVGGLVQLSSAGQIVESIWSGLPGRFAGIEIDAYVVMPNHFHGIVMVPDWVDGARESASTALGAIIRAFKAASCRAVRTSNQSEFGWQRNYYEHVIRNEADLDRVRRYVVENPLRWELDEENPAVVRRGGEAR